jgi:hypothetical protein
MQHDPVRSRMYLLMSFWYPRHLEMHMDEGSACGSKPMSNTLFGGTNSHQQKDFDVKKRSKLFYVERSPLWHYFVIVSDMSYGIYFLTFFSGTLFGVYSDILFGMLSGIYSDIFSGILSLVSSQILCAWRPAGITLIQRFLFGSGGEHCDLESRACSWGPADEGGGRRAGWHKIKQPSPDRWGINWQKECQTECEI